MKIKARSNNPLKKRARKGFRGFPVATVAFYGPDDRHANKLVIGIINHEGAEPELRKWYSEDADIRSLPNIEAEIQTFIKQHGVLSVSIESSDVRTKKRLTILMARRARSVHFGAVETDLLAR